MRRPNQAEIEAAVLAAEPACSADDDGSTCEAVLDKVSADWDEGSGECPVHGWRYWYVDPEGMEDVEGEPEDDTT